MSRNRFPRMNRIDMLVDQRIATLSASTTTGHDMWLHAALVKATAGGGYALDAEISQVLSTDGLSSVADIGGAGASLLRGLMNANGKLKGILFDLPNAVAGAA